jgi:hypothetical protein
MSNKLFNLGYYCAITGWIFFEDTVFFTNAGVGRIHKNVNIECEIRFR